MKTLSVNGIELAYDVRGDGPPLLLLHGFFGSSGDWVHLFDLDELAKSWRLIMPDARGHGRSTNPSGLFTHRQAADDVRALLDHLELDRVKTIGLSFGGNTLLHLATAPATRARLEAMVTIGAPSYFPRRRARSCPPSPSRAALRTTGARCARAIRRGTTRSARSGGPRRAFSIDTEDQAFTPPQLATIEARTLIVIGDRDPLYPLEIFVEQYRAIPRAALHVIPNGGHDAVFRAARPDFVRATLAFLRQ